MELQLLNIEERERYNLLTDQEEQAYKAGQESALEKLGDIFSELSEYMEYYSNQCEEARDDLEADILFMGTRSTPQELIDDKEVKKRYDDAIERFDKFEDKFKALQNIIDGIVADSEDGIESIKDFNKYEEKYND